MVTIRNKLNQPLVLNLDGGKSLNLFARHIADISAKDIESSPHIQTLIIQGDIVILDSDTGDVKNSKSNSNNPKDESSKTVIDSSAQKPVKRNQTTKISTKRK
ncbi:MAG: hypothetical protein GXY86_03445 [Firmicutes bacterium]|nr:hypothetical protein [Bacillota bacterium]